MQNIIFNDFDKAVLGKLQDHYSVKSIAEMYDLSPKTIWKWIRAGTIKAHKIGGAVRIPKSEVLKIVEDWMPLN